MPMGGAVAPPAPPLATLLEITMRKVRLEFCGNVRLYRIHWQAKLFEIMFGKVPVFISKRNALRFHLLIYSLVECLSIV